MVSSTFFRTFAGCFYKDCTMKKKILVFLSVCVLVCSPALAQEFEYEGIKYACLTDTTAQVGYNYGSTKVKGNLVIPESVTYDGRQLKVTAIGEYALGFCDSLERVRLPETIKELSYGCFEWCKNLKEVVLPKTMTAMGYANFLNCTALESFTLPDSLRTLGDGNFEGCTQLKEFHWNDVIETVGDYEFERCERLEEMIVPSTVTTIGRGCFERCTGLRRVTVPATLKTLGEEAFSECTALETVNWEHIALTVIPDKAFRYCKSLNHLDLPETVTRIGYNAFEGSGLQSVVFGPNIERIASEAFKDCGNIEEVYLRTDKLDELSRWNDYFSPLSFYFATLYVPEGQKNKYLHLNYWQQFYHIAEENTSGTEYCLIDVKTNGYNTFVNDEEIMFETHLEQPKGSALTVRFTFDKSMFADGSTRYLKGMTVNGVERLQDCKDGTLVIDVTEDLDIRVDVGFYTASLAVYQDEQGGLEFLCERDNETNVIVMPAEGYRATISYGPWMKTYEWDHPWRENYTATDSQPKTFQMWPREDVEIKVKYQKK